MKSTKSFYAAALAVALTVSTASRSEAKNIRVSITTNQDAVITSYAIKGDAKAIYLNPNEKAPVGSPMAWSNIKTIYWEEPADWKAAWTAWTRRDYAAAGKEFATLIETYKGFEQVEDSYGAKAVYYYGECLRRTGDYAKLMPVYEQAKAVNLSSSYQRQIALFNYWGHAGKKLWGPLELITDKFSIPASQIEKEMPHTVPPTTPPLKKYDPELLVQIAYLRGLAHEMNARKEHEEAVKQLNVEVPETVQAVSVAWASVKASLADYARVFTLAYMSDQRLSKTAMERSMAILKEDPLIEKDYITQMEAHALAIYYKDLFGGGTVPAAYKGFLKVPEEPKGEWQSSESAEDEDDDEKADDDKKPEGEE